MNIDYFNLVEGFFWISLGVWLMWTRRFIHKQPLHTRAITLIAFGISDFVEMHTGAWWTPVWLLVWKTVCIGVLISFVNLYFIERKRK
jgi:hypothetical protein